MMENGTITPFLVKRSIKGEEGGGGIINNGSSYSENPDQKAERGF